MALEVERKFLVKGGGWRVLGTPVLIRQGYLATGPERVVRVRMAGERAWLTIKGLNFGAARREYEYAIPLEDATEMLGVEGLCERPILEKWRTRIRCGEVWWEVDEFLGENAGLVVAEVELREPGQALDLPEWVGEEVTGDARYFNSNLPAHPFTRWAGAKKGAG
jgi:adenylate cyclase